MYNLALPTEYSFQRVFGKIDDIVNTQTEIAGIADKWNTFGHIKWGKACEKRGIKPIYGVKLTVIRDSEINKRFPDWQTEIVLLAKNNKGLKALYQTVTRTYETYYYWPRLLYSDFKRIDRNIIIAGSPFFRSERLDYIIQSPSNKYNVKKGKPNLYLPIDVRYPIPETKPIYEAIAYRKGIENQTWPQYILSEEEARYLFGNEAVDNTFIVGELCNATIPNSDMVRYPNHPNIRDFCISRSRERGIDLKNDVYNRRLDYEIKLITEKGYIDYFFIVADMINQAKRKMLVGPSRGSSAGSLVCYLMGITEIDPIKHGLLFERFIDINRHDLPDIDIDFPDSKRDLVIKYLEYKYGANKVKQLSNINTFKPKSAIEQFAIALGIPPSDTEAVKSAIIERSSGDARAAMCIQDTFDSTEIGRQFIEKYPAMADVKYIEEHASHAGKHAAAIIVSNHELINFGSIDLKTNCMMMDKKAAESIGLLKIDALGLMNLSVLQECAEAIGKDFHFYYDLQLDNKATFKIFNDMRLTGVFQFDGYALRSLTRQMGVNEFNDLVAITSLARPGPLNSGGATLFAERKTGLKPIEYLSDHESVIKNTEETLGIIIYQEQLMNIAREYGNMSWEDVSDLRRAASKSLGEEFFNRYKDKFIAGAIQNGRQVQEAEDVWLNMMTFGSWGFNKSHAVSYSLISYWTAYMKAHYPLEFAVASLNHIQWEDRSIKFLRDMVIHDKIEYVALDPDISENKWIVRNKKLYGPLTLLDGIGEVKAKTIMKARQGKAKLTPALFKKLMNPKTKFDNIFPAENNWGHIYKSPNSYGLKEKPTVISKINDPGDYVFIGCLKDRNLRDLNEYNVLVKRGYRIDENNLYLNMVLEDDTDSIICTINRYNFKRLEGTKIAEQGKVDEDWFLVKGKVRDKWRRIDIDEIFNLTEWRKNK